jgi:ADP-L-glycero-D-manno-heptose 6-epimerase
MIIVTGATGFIGSVLVWDLNQRGYENLCVVDAVRPEERPRLLADKKYQLFLHRDELFGRLKDKSFRNEVKGVFHMGACSSTTEMNRDFLKRVNTDYSVDLFKFCHEMDIPYIYASSGAVYGDGRQGFDDRTSPTAFTPLNPYGDSKLTMDIWADKQSKTPPRWYGLRFFNVYGPNEYHKQEMSSVVFKAFHQIKDTGRLKLFKSHHPDFEDGMQMRDFVYVKDITQWMIHLYEKKHAASGIYNMGYGKARTWLDLASAVFKNMNREMDIEWIEIPPHIRDQYQYFTEAVMGKLLGQGLPLPQWDLEAGVADYVTKYLTPGDKCV